MNANHSLIRIAIFYDGSFFHRVSSFYKHNHRRQAFLNFQGIHEFVRMKVSELEEIRPEMCHVVEAHFYRGRFSISKAKEKNQLETDRFFDQLLMYAGIAAHYFPMNEAMDRPVEKGVDVWMSLDAFDLAIHKEYDIVVLFAGDTDFIPLVRKLHSVGTRVMVLGWDLEAEGDDGRLYVTRTSSILMNEARYPVWMNEEIEEGDENDWVVNGLFAQGGGNSKSSDDY
jgi:uncharacterized LabA/DUF88 family protein